MSKHSNANEVELENPETSENGTYSESAPPIKNWNKANRKMSDQKEPTADNPSDEHRDQSIEELIKKLAKSFSAQQDAVVNHRKTLLTWFAWITAIQLLVINILILICMLSGKILGDYQILDAVLDFIKFFVGATFLELMGGLLIIVKYVFSREAYDMLKHLTRVEPAEIDQKK